MRPAPTPTSRRRRSNLSRVLLLLPTTTYRTTAFVEAARRLGVELTVASEQPSTFEPAQPANLLTLDFAAPERAADQAQRFASEHPIDAVVGVDDDTVVVAAGIAGALRLRGNPPAAALAARDKHRQRLALAAAGVPVPRFSLHALDAPIQQLAERVVYPCVIKPLRLSASRGVMRADTPAEFLTMHLRLRSIEQSDPAVCGDWARQFLIEEFVRGPEVALEGLLIGGTLRVLALFDKPDPLDGPFFEETIYVTPSRLPASAQEALARCAQDAARALTLAEGPVHAELRWNDRGPCLIELAARPIGGRCSAALRFGNDVSLEELILRHALGMPLPALERERRAAGVMMIPIPGAGRLREVRGVAEARAVPLVDDVAITAHPGEVLVPLPEGSRYPGFIFARGDTPEAVEGALRAAHARLRFVLEPAPA
jgi:biotin carboxylase